MEDFASKYNEYIREKLGEGWSYERVKAFGKDSYPEALMELGDMIDYEFWDKDMTLEEWEDYVALFEKNNPRPFVPGAVTISDDFAPRKEVVPRNNPESAWRRLKTAYRRSMSDHSVDNIEYSAIEVANQLSSDTTKTGPVKGLVFGSVQSGKTANMEALMCVAADEGWNIFIVLTGTIEALRQQTKRRFEKDLPCSTAINWQHIDIAGDERRMHSSDLSLGVEGKSDPGNRYVLTVLKQKSRLVKLIDWLYSTPARTQRMRIVVIDDEADQASINTAVILDGEDAETYEQDRKAINQLICRLVNGQRADGSEPAVRFRAMNYISFTATPYANVLNEKSAESLYPKDFVHALSDPKEYFGCNVIFGNDDMLDDNGEQLCPGLDIVRIIGDDEVDAIKDVHTGKGWGIPAGLRDALLWFVCAAAVLRIEGHKKPISMLVHTSPKTDHHFVDCDLIKDFFGGMSDAGLLEECQRIYEYETARFGYEAFGRSFSGYGLLDQVTRELPTFNEIKGEILSIVDEVGSPMELASELGVTYSPGINLCVDNCKAKATQEAGVHLRLVYPGPEDLSAMDKAPVFIVMGGNTLARGLTLEGLVCSYFTRSVTQADTLMQMARWFGYRKGYELLQRIWMTTDARKKFRELSKADMDLKLEIARFAKLGLRPSQLGIKVSSMPNVSKFMVTSKNKMQLSVFADHDFSGHNAELTQYDFSKEMLLANERLSIDFLEDLQKLSPATRGVRDSFVWRDVPCERVSAYLGAFAISKESSLHEDLPRFLAWLEDEGLSRFPCWSVAVCGKKNSPSGFWDLSSLSGLPRIERSRKKDDEACINIGSLRDGFDALCDIDESSLNSLQREIYGEVKASSRGISRVRGALGYEWVPILLVYRIDKLSSPKRKSVDRAGLGSEVDLFGFSYVIPGEERSSSGTKLWIDLEGVM